MTYEIQYRNNNRIKTSGYGSKIVLNTIAGHTYNYTAKEYKKNRIKIPWFKPSGFTMV